MAKDKKETGLVVRDAAELSEFDDLFGGFDSLPRMDISCGNSACCDDGAVPVGHFYIKDGEEFIDLGTELDAMVLQMRAKALAFEPKLRIVYDQKHPEFATISKEAKTEDYASNGIEFIFYNGEKFCTFYLKSTTNKRRGKSIAKCMGACAHLKIDKCSNDKYSWYSYKCEPTAKTLDLPDNTNDVVGEFVSADNVLPSDEDE